ncbi:MAG: polysaccharide deacetylase family protein [Patescibacteria group bacterium]
MTILIYHDVLVNKTLDPFDQIDGGRTTAAEFRRQMKYLRRHWEVISIQAIVTALKAGIRIPRACAVTFDDGFSGVLTCALPIIRELAIPATLYVMSGLVEGPTTHFNATEIAFRLTRASAVDLSDCGAGILSCRTTKERAIAMKRAKAALRLLPRALEREQREKLHRQLGVSIRDIEHYAATDPRFRYLRWVEIKELARVGFTIGSHTRTHPSLPQIKSPEVIREEVEGGRRDLAENLDMEPFHFAYPYGHVTREIRDLVEQVGFLSASTTDPGENIPGVDPFLLRRINFRNLPR